MNLSSGMTDWDGYLDRFHQGRPGITERILSRSVDPSGATAYGWVTSLLPESGQILDIACGSAPIWTPRLATRYLGVDASSSEVALAHDRGAHDVVVGSALSLPVHDGSVAAAVCSMALMVLPRLDAALSEIRRVLAPDGVLIAIVPTGPKRVEDVAVTLGLLRAVGSSISYRNDRDLRHADRLFARHGLQITQDTTQSYSFPLSDEHAAAELASSLYLGPPQAEREEKARRYFERVAHHREAFPVPIRRILAHRLTGEKQ